MRPPQHHFQHKARAHIGQQQQQRADIQHAHGLAAAPAEPRAPQQQARQTPARPAPRTRSCGPSARRARPVELLGEQQARQQRGRQQHEAGLRRSGRSGAPVSAGAGRQCGSAARWIFRRASSARHAPRRRRTAHMTQCPAPSAAAARARRTRAAACPGKPAPAARHGTQPGQCPARLQLREQPAFNGVNRQHQPGRDRQGRRKPEARRGSPSRLQPAQWRAAAQAAIRPCAAGAGQARQPPAPGWHRRPRPPATARHPRGTEALGKIMSRSLALRGSLLFPPYLLQPHVRGAIHGLRPYRQTLTPGQGNAWPGPHHRSQRQDMLREVRMALLEADVALPVVRDFIARVKEKALGQEVLGSLNARPGAGGHRQPRTRRHHGRGRQRHQPRSPAAGGDPDGRPAGRGQDHHHRQAGQAPDRKAQEEGADGLGRRVPPGRHRAAQDGDGAGRRRVVPQHARPETGGHRARRTRLRAQALLSTCCWSTPPAAWPSMKR
jgi:hypothetical protein